MLKDSLIEKFISNKRFNKYENLEEYGENLIFSKQAYIPLALLEIALRNSLDNFLSKKISDNWINDDLKAIYKNLHFVKSEILKSVGEKIEKEEKIMKLNILKEQNIKTI
jgi:hypothetical protein